MKRTLRNTARLLTLITTIGLITCGISCKDDDDSKLPPITSYGAGTFACMIDGVRYIPSGSYHDAFVQSTSDMIVITASGSQGTFNLSVADTTSEIVIGKEYYFDNKERSIQCSVNGLQCSGFDKPVSGFIRFSKIDYDKRVIAGVFQFTVFSTKCNRIINVTEGRFDLRTDR
jgi:hypothetical protein